MIRMIAAAIAVLSVFYGSARGAEKFENVARLRDDRPVRRRVAFQQ
jgi:hypothetical protein